MLHLTVPARKVYPASGALPSGPAVPVAGSTDLRYGVPMKGRVFDHAFTALEGEAIRLSWPGEEVAVTLTADPALDHLFVYAPALHNGVPAPFACVEPVSHAVNGFNLKEDGWKDTGVQTVAPGKMFLARWTLAVEAG